MGFQALSQTSISLGEGLDMLWSPNVYRMEKFSSDRQMVDSES